MGEQDHMASRDPSPSASGVRELVTPRSRAIYWRCFHCGEAFTKAQERWAREHFGRDEGELPVCQMRVPGEHHLLILLRRAEDELARYRNEDTDLWRALYFQAADHAGALRREEERGYERGVRDARAETATASPAERPVTGPGMPTNEPGQALAEAEGTKP